MTDTIVVMVTAPGMEKATEMARTLVEEHLCACVNIVPGVRSIYVFEDKLCDDAEVLCVIKTRVELFGPLRDRIAALHPYKIPEILALAVDDANAPYLDWVRASTRAP